MHIPVGELPSRIGELERFRGRDIITVCRSGARAGTAARLLIAAGFKNVAVLKGGMMEWNAP